MSRGHGSRQDQIKRLTEALEPGEWVPTTLLIGAGTTADASSIRRAVKTLETSGAIQVKTVPHTIMGKSGRQVFGRVGAPLVEPWKYVAWLLERDYEATRTNSGGSESIANQLWREDVRTADYMLEVLKEIDLSFHSLANCSYWGHFTKAEKTKISEAIADLNQRTSAIEKLVMNNNRAN